MWMPSQDSTWWYVLDCLKSMYGLNDAPLAWQLVLQDCQLEKRKGIQSQFDECLVWWMKRSGEVLALLTCHVDDNAVASEQWRLDKEFELFSKEFGGATKCSLPFQHCGIRHKKTSRDFLH